MSAEDAGFEYANEDFDGGDTKGHAPGEKKNSMKKKANEAAGNFVTDNAQKIFPVAMKALDGLETAYALAYPYGVKAYKIYNDVLKVLEPYGVEEIMTCVTGVIMIFFGGAFATLTAVYEAIVQGGFQTFKEHMTLLYNEYKSFKAANSQDDLVDDDNDGIADVEQISAEQYAVRKTLLAFRATDPANINKALQSLYMIFIAVMATLRLRFARTISLGSSIGDQGTQLFMKYVEPNLKSMIADEAYHKWVGPFGTYACRIIGVMIAFRIQRILTTFHTAVKGARTLTKGLTALAERNGYGYLTEGYLDEIISGAMAVTGIIVQVFMWSSVPLPVRLLLFPLFIVEGLLSMFVSVGLTMSSPAPVA